MAQEAGLLVLVRNFAVVDNSYYFHSKYLHNTFPWSDLGHRLGEGGCLLGGADGGEPLLRRALGGEVEVEAVAGDQPQRGQGHAPPQQAQPPAHQYILFKAYSLYM